MPSFIRFLALTGLLLFPALSFGVRGQEGNNKQRPRRVIASPEQSASRTTGQAKGEPKPQEVEEGDVVRVETQLVSVPAVVTNKGGRPLTGLRAENFALFENGEQQKITNFATTEAPFEIALLLDTSGSTRADVKERIWAEEREEDQRLMYVALTRAQPAGLDDEQRVAGFALAQREFAIGKVSDVHVGLRPPGRRRPAQGLRPWPA